MSEDNKNNVDLYGKVGILPKNTKASKGIQFLENIRVKKTKLWYLLVEKYTDEDGQTLQLVKYNQYKGVDLTVFVKSLKEHYVETFSKVQPDISEKFDEIIVSGTDKFATLSNIPDFDLAGKKLVTRITEDLVKLLK